MSNLILFQSAVRPTTDFSSGEIVASHWVLLVSLMAAAGGVCGLAKFLAFWVGLSTNLEKSSETAFPTLELFLMLAQSLIAAFMTPLVLNMLSSDLVPRALGQDNGVVDVSSLFVFVGFTLVTAWTGTDLIDLMSQRVLDLIRKDLEQTKKDLKEATEAAKEAEREAATVADRRTEPDALPSGHESGRLQAASLASNQADLTDKQKAILKAMYDSQYDFRSSRGVAKDSQLADDVVKRELEQLQLTGLVDTRKGRGPTAWYLTRSGIQSIAIQEEPN